MLTFTQQLPGGARASRSGTARSSNTIRATVVKRLPRGTEIGRPYLFNLFGISVKPAWWPFPVLHELHLSPVFVGFRVDDLALWTAKGSARRLTKVREWEG